jgi:hypothetical protein
VAAIPAKIDTTAQASRSDLVFKKRLQEILENDLTYDPSRGKGPLETPA